MRSGASVAQLRAVRVVPRAARTGRAPGSDVVMSETPRASSEVVGTSRLTQRIRGTVKGCGACETITSDRVRRTHDPNGRRSGSGTAETPGSDGGGDRPGG